MTHSFHRGSLALDLAGTVGARASGHPEERLPDPGALDRWLAEAGLAAETAAGPEDLEEGRKLREAIWAAADGVLRGRPVRRADRAAINRAARWQRLGAPQLSAAQSVRWVGRSPVRLALGRVAADAIELLARRADHLTRCQLDGCGTLLLSRSRSEPRRWCSMETCGNRAKAAAFRRRARHARPRIRAGSRSGR